MQSTEHITCPNCRAEVLMPPATRTIHIDVSPGTEPVVTAPGFLPWELDSAMVRATELVRDRLPDDDEEEDDEDE